MRAICDSCESAVAVFFCPAVEAAICDSCNKKDHQLAELNGCDCQLTTCDKLVCYHTRLPLVDSGNFLRCELCDTQPAFLHCEKDAMSLCLKCDMLVHNAPHKKMHARFLILTQQVQLMGASRLDSRPSEPKVAEAVENGGQNQPPVKLEAESRKEQLTGASRLDSRPSEPKVAEAVENGGQNQPPVKLKAEKNKPKNLRRPRLPMAKAKRSACNRGPAKILGFKPIDLHRKHHQSSASNKG